MSMNADAVELYAHRRLLEQQAMGLSTGTAIASIFATSGHSKRRHRFLNKLKKA